MIRISPDGESFDIFNLHPAHVYVLVAHLEVLADLYDDLDAQEALQSYAQLMGQLEGDEQSWEE